MTSKRRQKRIDLAPTMTGKDDGNNGFIRISFMFLTLLCTCGLFACQSTKKEEASPEWSPLKTSKEASPPAENEPVTVVTLHVNKEQKKDQTDLLERVADTLSVRMANHGWVAFQIQKKPPNLLRIRLPEVKKSEMKELKNILTTRGKMGLYLEASREAYTNASPPDSHPEGTMWKKLKRDFRGAGFGQNPRWILLQKQPDLDHNDIRDARSSSRPGSRVFHVNLRLTDRGTRKFAELTQKHVGRSIAIIRDGEILSVPKIREPIRGGVARIAGKFSKTKADVLATVLESNPLPVPVEIKSIK